MLVKVFIYDTETAGLPKHYKPAEQDLNNYPHVLQLGGQLIEINTDNLDDCKVLYTLNLLVKPYRFNQPITIDEKAEKVHGISFDKADKEGVDILTALYIFRGLTNSCDFIVCHNVGFDRNVMVSESLNHGISASVKYGTKAFCTMKFATELLKLPGRYAGQFKYPTLSELFSYLTEQNLEDFHTAHDALGDVNATRDCLLLLLKEQPKLLQWFSKEIEDIY